MAPKITLKFHHSNNNDIRRITIVPPSFLELKGVIKNLFGLCDTKFKISYQDSEGDTIGVFSQLEWETVCEEASIPKLLIESQEDKVSLNEPATANQPLLLVKLVVDPKYLDYGVSIVDEKIQSLEESFPSILQRYFEGQPINAEHTPAWIKKSLKYIYVGPRATVVEVSIARFCKCLFRKSLGLLQDPSCLLQGKNTLMEVVEMFQHPAIHWAIAFVELLLGNKEKAAEHIQQILQFEEDLWEGLEEHEFFEELRAMEKYSQLVSMFGEAVKKREEAKQESERKLQEQAKKLQEEADKARMEELSIKYSSSVRILKNMGTELTLEKLELLAHLKGDIASFFDICFA